MKKPLINHLSTLHNLILVAFLFLVQASCTTEVKKDSNISNDEMIAAANNLDSLFLAAFNNGDAEAIMDLHWNSPELRAYPPGEMQVNGFDAVKESYVRDFASNKGARLEYTTQNNIPFADGVVGHGTFRWSMPMEGGPPMVFDGRYSEVKAFKDGKMVIILDHASMPLPPSPVDTTQMN